MEARDNQSLDPNEADWHTEIRDMKGFCRATNV